MPMASGFPGSFLFSPHPTVLVYRDVLDPILSTKSLVLLYGPRGMGKTFVALRLRMLARRRRIGCESGLRGPQASNRRLEIGRCDLGGFIAANFGSSDV
jgi:hypothetical protein